MRQFRLVTHVHFRGVTLTLCNLVECNTVSWHSSSTCIHISPSVTANSYWWRRRTKSKAVGAIHVWLLYLNKYQQICLQNVFQIRNVQIEVLSGWNSQLLSYLASFTPVWKKPPKLAAHVHNLWTRSFQKMLPYFKALINILVAEKS